jgi:hypothetical protein
MASDKPIIARKSALFVVRFIFPVAAATIVGVVAT